MQNYCNSIVRYDPLSIKSSTNILYIDVPDNLSLGIKVNNDNIVPFVNNKFDLNSIKKYGIITFDIFYYNSNKWLALCKPFCCNIKQVGGLRHRWTYFIAIFNEFQKNKDKYNDQLLSLIIEYQIYHVFQLHNYKTIKRIKLKPNEINFIITCIENNNINNDYQNGLNWFKKLCMLLYSNFWLVLFPPLSVNDSVSIQRMKRLKQGRLIHIISAEDADIILSSDDFPVNSTIIRPSFTCNGFSISCKTVNGIQNFIINKNISILSAIRTSDNMNLFLSNNLKHQLYDKNDIIKYMLPSINKIINVDGYHKIWTLNGTYRNVSFDRYYYHDIVDYDNNIEFFFRIYGDDVNLYRQLLIPFNQFKRDILIKKIEGQLIQEFDHLCVITEIYEIRGSKRIVIDNKYQRCNNSSNDLEIILKKF